MTAPRHWAAHLIGQPWTPEYRCWDLVREVFAIRYGISMPIVAVGSEGNADVIRAASSVSGWVPAPSPEEDGDIVLMRGREGRHVGVIIATSRGLMLLHNSGTMGADGRPHGSVLAQPLRDLTAAGYHSFEIWRRSSP